MALWARAPSRDVVTLAAVLSASDPEPRELEGREGREGGTRRGKKGFFEYILSVSWDVVFGQMDVFSSSSLGDIFHLGGPVSRQAAACKAKESGGLVIFTPKATCKPGGFLTKNPQGDPCHVADAETTASLFWS